MTDTEKERERRRALVQCPLSKSFLKTSEIATLETRLKEKKGKKTLQGATFIIKNFFTLKRIGYSMQKEIMVDCCGCYIATKDGWVQGEGFSNREKRASDKASEATHIKLYERYQATTLAKGSIFTMCALPNPNSLHSFFLLTLSFTNR